MENMWLWVGFNGFVFTLLALDLGVLHRRAHEVSMREAATWSTAWVVLALAFAAGVRSAMGPDAGLEFLTGYVVEKALSVDNLFVFVVIFASFRVPAELQHRVLFWGVLGALVMRAIMIAAGAALLASFHWIMYVFGALLLLTAWRLLVPAAGEGQLVNGLAVRLVGRVLRVTPDYHGQRFFVRLRAGERTVLYATPLFVALVTVELADAVFAVDSIPAVFAVTRDPFLVYSSNVFAILGLRSLYFLLAGAVRRFIYLKPAVALVLVIVGLKMLVSDFYKVPASVSLPVILAVFAVALLASLRKRQPMEQGVTP